MLKGFVFDRIKHKVNTAVQHSLGIAAEVSSLGKT
jgi:hypothetical protein